MAVRKSAGMRNARRGTKALRGDGLSTTPTQQGETSPDYRPTAGDPDYLKSYSEEQIGLLGGREAIFSRVESRRQRAAEAGFSDPEDTTANQETTLTTDTPEAVPGPITPPTTYGKGEMPKPGSKVGKKVQQGPAASKKKLQKRIARTTGGTRLEAKGIMRKARTQVRRGNTAGARRTISRALSGGPKAGVPRSPMRSRKAAKAATKITKRIEARQAPVRTKRKK